MLYAIWEEEAWFLPLSDEIDKSKCNVDVVQHVIVITQVSAVSNSTALNMVVLVTAKGRRAEAERN